MKIISKVKRWCNVAMLKQGSKLFSSIYKLKRHANPNHEIHYLKRELNQWLTQGIERIQSGTYSPRHTKRHYFADGMVEQLHVCDRVFQHLILKQLKPSFNHIVNPSCLHILGPNGVKVAADKIDKALQSKQYRYFIRADIKSYYRSIQHRILIDDVKNAFCDDKAIHMLTEIIKNPIDTPWGTKNPDYGLPLRGPLSQLFSALYLKPLDDAFSTSEVEYIRYQDDVLILCKSKRQLNRCQSKMHKILKTRQLSLSKKKSKVGLISQSFHFLGLHYLETQTQGNTNAQDKPCVQNKVSGGADKR